MTRAHDDLEREDSGQIMRTIWSHEHDGKEGWYPLALCNVRGCRFFPYFDNRWDGYFIDVTYHLHPTETYFVVDARNEDDEYHIERIS